MLDAGTRIHCSVPGALALAGFVKKIVRPGTVLTAYDDANLRPLRHLVDRELADIVPFGELVGRFCRMWGIACGSLANTGHREAVLGDILETLPPESFFAASGKYPGSARVLVDRLRELERFGLDAKAVESAALTPDRLLRDRLLSLTEIINQEEARLEQTAREKVFHRVARCLETEGVRATPLKHVVIFALEEAAPLYDQFCNWLAASGVEVDLVLRARTPGFALTCARFGAVVEEEAHWTDALFAGGVTDHAPGLSAFRAPDKLGEAEWAVRRCLAAVSSGVAHSQIGIMATDLESYGPLLLSAAERLGLPLSTSLTVPLLSVGLAGTICSLVEVLAGRDVRRLMHVARSSHLTAPGTSLDPLWSLLKEAHAQPDDPWTYLGTVAEPYPWLVEALSWRTEALATDATMTQWSDRLRLLGGSMMAAGPTLIDETMVRDNRAQNVLQRSLAEYAAVHGARALGLADFIRIGKRIWVNQRVSFESGREGVHVVGSPTQLTPVSTLVVLGSVEGVLPPRRRQDPVLNDECRERLNSLSPLYKLPLSEDALVQAQADFCWLAASCSHEIIFGYPDRDGDARVTPSYFLRELCRAAGKTFDEIVDIKGSSELIPALKDCTLQKDAEIASALEGPRHAEEWPSLVSTEAFKAIKHQPDEKMSVANLADYRECPFKATVEHKLGLEPRDSEVGIGRLMSLPLRASLHLVRDSAEARARLESELEKRLAELYPSVDAWEISMLRVAGERLIGGWVDREFKARQLWPRQPLPDGVGSVKLGEEGTAPQVRSEKGDVVQLGVEDFPVVTTRGGLVVRLYERKGPDPREDMLESDEATYYGSARWLRHGILLLALARHHPFSALEIETHEDSRWFLMYGDESPDFRTQGTELRALNRKGRAEGFHREVIGKLTEAIDAVYSGSIRPQPGAWCVSCDFGTLCRHSRELVQEGY